jgi:cation:H+ antiporter
MNSSLAFTIAILAGFAGLIWSADKFVLGASTTARTLGVSPLVIGLTIVALGTSAPEIFTSATAALTGSPEIAIGNVLGSNIANIGLILGLTLLIRPVAIPASLMKKEIPVLVLVTFSVFMLFFDNDLDWIDGCLLLVMLALFVWHMFRSASVRANTEITNDAEIAEFLTRLPLGQALLLMLFSLSLMVLSSNVLVWGAHNIALALGVSELVVGLTIVAIGTSLPELATSLTSALKGHDELAIGNLVGSNILNILLVLPFPALLGTVAISPEVLARDYAVMLAFTVLLALIIYTLVPRRGRLGRKSGTVFIVFYLAYTASLIF